jgi:HD superfamily phosphohydrolase YqeK
MATQAEIDAVLTAIDNHTGPNPSGSTCGNEEIVTATGLDPETVAGILHDLWKSDQIEGALGLGGIKPSLIGIARVIPGQPRLWGNDGRYRVQP